MEIGWKVMIDSFFVLGVSFYFGGNHGYSVLYL